MAIQTFKDDIHKDTQIFGYKTYLGNGQGCGTIFYKNVAVARKALKTNGIKQGSDLFDCSKCACHFSSTDPKFNHFIMFACSQAKKDYAKSFED